MLFPSAELDAVAQIVDLESSVCQVEQRLAALSDALRERDANAVALHADAVHQALADAVNAFMHAARHGGVPTAMRLRLSHASAQVARQREVLARATAALDRAIDLLLPDEASHTKVYNAAGLRGPRSRQGSLNA